MYGREGKEGCDEDAIFASLEVVQRVERVVALVVLYIGGVHS